MAEDGTITALLGIDYYYAWVSILSSFCLPPKEQSSSLGPVCRRKQVIQILIPLSNITTYLWSSRFRH